jgi:carbon storage regulator CsrA
MLVLTRERDEKVLIQLPAPQDGPEIEIEVQVVEIGDRKVRLGFTASEAVKIHREEVALRIKRAKER